jgi:DNA-binding LacI/PurR family transcriptional regulator
LNPETIAIIAQHQKLSHRAAAAGFAFAKMREYRSDLSVMERTESNMVRISRMLTPQVAGSGISAWIGINDETAILVQLQLARLGCDSRVAVVGFDNSANATQYDLSSYDFAFSEIARRMIGFVLHPADPLFSNQKTVECEGFFVERATVLEVSTAREESGGKKAIR